jgi:crotonobetainyl-CoA:carnitine CoA-transferase CaiB-like acyl-CoA transferase
LEDQRFETVEKRRENRGALEAEIENIFLEHDHTEWLQRLKKAQLPYGEVRGIAEVLAHPQATARRLIREVESPVGKVPVVGNPVRLSASPARYDAIPDLGEHTEAILKRLGYDDGTIQKLRSEKII